MYRPSKPAPAISRAQARIKYNREHGLVMRTLRAIGNSFGKGCHQFRQAIKLPANFEMLDYMQSLEAVAFPSTPSVSGAGYVVGYIPRAPVDDALDVHYFLPLREWPKTMDPQELEAQRIEAEEHAETVNASLERLIVATSSPFELRELHQALANAIHRMEQLSDDELGATLASLPRRSSSCRIRTTEDAGPAGVRGASAPADFPGTHGAPGNPGTPAFAPA